MDKKELIKKEKELKHVTEIFRFLSKKNEFGLLKQFVAEKKEVLFGTSDPQYQDKVNKFLKTIKDEQKASLGIENRTPDKILIDEIETNKNNILKFLKKGDMLNVLNILKKMDDWSFLMETNQPINIKKLSNLSFAHHILSNAFMYNDNFYNQKEKDHYIKSTGAQCEIIKMMLEKNYDLQKKDSLWNLSPVDIALMECNSKILLKIPKLIKNYKSNGLINEQIVENYRHNKYQSIKPSAFGNIDKTSKTIPIVAGILDTPRNGYEFLVEEWQDRGVKKGIETFIDLLFKNAPRLLFIKDDNHKNCLDYLVENKKILSLFFNQFMSSPFEKEIFLALNKPISKKDPAPETALPAWIHAKETDLFSMSIAKQKLLKISSIQLSQLKNKKIKAFAEKISINEGLQGSGITPAKIKNKIL